MKTFLKGGDAGKQRASRLSKNGERNAFSCLEFVRISHGHAEGASTKCIVCR